MNTLLKFSIDGDMRMFKGMAVYTNLESTYVINANTKTTLKS